MKSRHVRLPARWDEVKQDSAKQAVLGFFPSLREAGDDTGGGSAGEAAGAAGASSKKGAE
jgi:hypothetical protein